MLKKILIALCGMLVLGGQMQAAPNDWEKQFLSEGGSKDDLNVLISSTRASLAAHTKNHAGVLAEFDSLVGEWKDYAADDFNMRKMLQACVYAAQKHEGQIHSGASAPHVLHALNVAETLWKVGKVKKSDVLAAALLHDAVKGKNVSFDEVEKIFDKDVRKTVEELSHMEADKASSLSSDGKLVKLADRLQNVRYLHKPPADWNKMDTLRYLFHGDRLLKALKGTNGGIEKALDQEILTLVAANKV